jgi:hypothetical protein
MEILQNLYMWTFGLIMGITLMGYAWDTDQMKKDIRICEQSLTRTEHCVMAAVQAPTTVKQ